MKKHIPNAYPLRTRLALVFCAAIFLLVTVSGLVTGQFFLPGKRGGIFLSGIPTLMIATATAMLCIAALSVIVDHYDRRPNEAGYSFSRRFCLKAALCLYIAAPLLELAEYILWSEGVNIFPSFHGLASNFTLHSHSLYAYVRYPEMIFEYGWQIGVPGFVCLTLGVLIDKYPEPKPQRVAYFLMGLGGILLITLWLAVLTKSFMIGQVDAGRANSRIVIYAFKEPAKFNAVMLTEFLMAVFLMFGSIVVLFSALFDRDFYGRIKRYR